MPFTIKVVDSEDVNAFALPGGFFFVNSGLILKADTEAELAGVMAHEIAHVAARQLCGDFCSHQHVLSNPLSDRQVQLVYRVKEFLQPDHPHIVQKAA